MLFIPFIINHSLSYQFPFQKSTINPNPFVDLGFSMFILYGFSKCFD